METNTLLTQCPHCGSDNLHMSEEYDYTGNSCLSLEVKCKECGLSWFEFYRYTHAFYFWFSDGEEIKEPGEDWVSNSL